VLFACNKQRVFASCLLVAGLLGPVAPDATTVTEERVLRIHLDADRTGGFDAARAIEMGIRTALSHTELVPDGIRFEVVPKDHRNNAKRSLKNLLEYDRDPNGLAVIGGKESPPYLTYRDRINADEILLLLPWSAAGPITRTETDENWIFRASVDDSKAGAFLVQKALLQNECKAPALLMLNSGWGRYNEQNIREALKQYQIENVPTFFIDADISLEMSRITARDIVRAGADCVIYVGTVEGGAAIISEVASAPDAIQVISHWGILGNDFMRRTSFSDLERVNFQFLQTCFPFGQPDNPAVIKATQAARSLFPDEFQSLEELRAPTGFVHGYDLGLLLLAGLRQSDVTAPIEELRRSVRSALENLDSPVHGLMKAYRTPFSQEGFDAHEALGAADLCLAKYDAEGRVMLISDNRPKSY
jgi:branched-chain amino acid transport system substrate-binding protein